MRIRFVPTALLGAAATLPAGWLLWLRPRVRAWGAGPNDTYRPLPGDDVVPRPEIAHTHAVTIAAPPTAVWPWLVQMGQGRGGLYSYDALENLVGCDIHSVDRIDPALQGLAVGDVVSLRKGGTPAFVVSAIDPGRSIVLQARDPSTGGSLRMDPAAPLSVDETWAFVVEPTSDGQTRLLVRGRRRTRDARLDRVFWSVVEVLGFVMERKMLLGIRDRAERRPGDQAIPAGAPA